MRNRYINIQIVGRHNKDCKIWKHKQLKVPLSHTKSLINKLNKLIKVQVIGSKLQGFGFVFNI
jgi:hypothetical protein